MSARLSTVVIDCHDPRTLADFWARVLGWKVLDVDDDGSVEIGDGEGNGPRLLFEPVPEPKTIKNRIHLDINPVGADQTEELDRLLDLGAQRVDIGQGEQTWVVLADPEGNEFCLLRTQMEAASAG